MQVPDVLGRGARFLVVVLASLAGLPLVARAQDVPGGAQLGMTVQQLEQAVPALRRNANPARLAGGLLGAWSAPAFALAGVPMTPTFFIGNGQVRRVEYVADDASLEAYEALLAWGRAQWGAELASAGPEGAYASWTHGEADAYLQRTASGARPTVRLVVKQRVEKDAGEL